MSVNENINFNGCHPADDDIGEEHGFIPLPTSTPEELIQLRAQVAESVTLQQALDVALLNSQNSTDVALQAIQNITAEKEFLVNDKAETRLSLEAKTQENADLFFQNQVIITERDSTLASLVEELTVFKAKVIHLEQAITDASLDTTQEQHARAFTEGNSADLNSKLLISEFNLAETIIENQNLLVSLEQENRI